MLVLSQNTPVKLHLQTAGFSSERGLFPAVNPVESFKSHLVITALPRKTFKIYVK